MQVTRPGDYEVWLGGSVRSEAELLVDGEAVAEVRHELNNLGQYVSFGDVPLERRRASHSSSVSRGPTCIPAAAAAAFRPVRSP